ncbi:MAG: hypothetical protein FJX75_05650 [Armatimonadetes bacterium]|nr:hypothetical protein [Armatimonadota bacterium]
MHRGSATLLVLLLTGLFIASLAHAQDGRSVVLRANGQLILKDADGEFGTLELNLHNSNWKYASQADATAQCEDQAAGGKAFTGALAVPDVAGAGISFLETISQGDDGLHVIYELKPSGPMILNGLQISLILPAERFAGQELVVRSAEAADRTVPLPRTLDPNQWQLGTIQGNVVQIGADAAKAITMKIDKTYGLILHDLRQWQRDEFEIRIPIVQEQQGKMLGTNDRFDLEITLGPGPIALTGP